MSPSYDYLNIGPSPVDEPCAQVGSADYNLRSRIECQVFIRQLQRLWPQGMFTVRSFPHDFGYYREVVALFPVNGSEDDPLVVAVYAAESQTPQKWDAIARLELESALAGAGLPLQAPQERTGQQ